VRCQPVPLGSEASGTCSPQGEAAVSTRAPTVVRCTSECRPARGGRSWPCASKSARIEPDVDSHPTHRLGRPASDADAAVPRRPPWRSDGESHRARVPCNSMEDRVVVRPSACSAEIETATIGRMNRSSSMAATQQRLFISYRRETAAGYAGWIHQLLSERLGKSSVFRLIHWRADPRRPRLAGC
jgi:hypothetical protein